MPFLNRAILMCTMAYAKDATTSSANLSSCVQDRLDNSKSRSAKDTRCHKQASGLKGYTRNNNSRYPGRLASSEFGTYAFDNTRHANDTLAHIVVKECKTRIASHKNGARSNNVILYLPRLSGTADYYSVESTCITY